MYINLESAVVCDINITYIHASMFLCNTTHTRRVGCVHNVRLKSKAIREAVCLRATTPMTKHANASMFLLSFVLCLIRRAAALPVLTRDDSLRHVVRNIHQEVAAEETSLVFELKSICFQWTNTDFRWKSTDTRTFYGFVKSGRSDQGKMAASKSLHAHVKHLSCLTRMWHFNRMSHCKDRQSF